MQKREVARGVAAGLAGTAAMTLTYDLEHVVRRRVTGPVDYDDGPVPALAAARLLDWSDPGPRSRQVLGLLVHWGYGSLVGVGALPLRRRLGPLPATLAWWAAVTVMAGTLFPLLGRTPPPWRWRPDVVATSLLQHLVYAAVVVAVLPAPAPEEGPASLQTGTTE